MATALDRIIDGASDSSISTTALLRLALTAAHRLRAVEVSEWSRRELSGYDGIERDRLPAYRRGQTSMARAHWTGYGGSSAKTMLDSIDGPSELASLFEISFRQPVPELESLAASDEMGVFWPTAAIAVWNKKVEEGKATGIAMMSLFSARTLVPKQALVGVLEAVRTEVLTLALELQSAARDAGEPGGPTIEDDPQVEGAVTNFVMNVYGGAPTIAQGASVMQTVTVNAGDLISLTHAAESVGLTSEALNEYVAAVLDARNDPEKSKLRAFAEKVRGGALALGNGVVGNIAATKLLEWGAMFLGG